MKMLGKLFLASLLVCGTAFNAYSAKPVKIKVYQDAFVQGGETADKALGQTTAQRLRVMKSDDNDKYSRMTFLQFDLKKVESFEELTLNICVRVLPNKKDAEAQFKLDVYSCLNNKWNETGITYNNKPEKDELLATDLLKPSDDNVWVKIVLPADKIKELKANDKKGKITLVLFNSSQDFNKTSIEVISKERKWSNGMLAKREAYLSLK